MSKKRVVIPPEECGPGSRIAEIDGQLCIVGVSGAIYKDVYFKREDIMPRNANGASTMCPTMPGCANSAPARPASRPS